MDPGETLRQINRSLTEIDELRGSLDDLNALEAMASAANNLVESCSALHEWLGRCGYMPSGAR